MPLYEYACPQCGPFTELLTLRAYTPTHACPECGGHAPRVISAPHLATLPRATRVALERNERAAHEPQRGTKSAPAQNGHTCTPKCRHQKGVNRPWMLGH
jgi:putative FmdB family regulatory protein